MSWKQGGRKCIRRGDHWSSADFAQAKSVAARRKNRLFSFGKSEKLRFSADEQCSPLHSDRKIKFWDRLFLRDFIQHSALRPQHCAIGRDQRRTQNCAAEDIGEPMDTGKEPGQDHEGGEAGEHGADHAAQGTGAESAV